MSQCFTSPNYEVDLISNRYGCFGDVQNPQKGNIYQPLKLHLCHYPLTIPGLTPIFFDTTNGWIDASSCFFFLFAKGSWWQISNVDKPTSINRCMNVSNCRFISIKHIQCLKTLPRHTPNDLSIGDASYKTHSTHDRVVPYSWLSCFKI